MKRIFLVGAPRSGTTILQALLASHPKITSFPETKFFHYLWTEKLKSKLPDRLREFFHKEICRPELYDELQIRRQSTTDRVAWFVGILDRLAAEEGNEIWLEKTPEHVYFIQDILNYLPEAKFVHIVRNPLDVVASMRKATSDRLNNALWGGEWTLDFSIERWKSSALISLRFRDTPQQHLVVRYEDLLQDKIRLLSICCYFIDIAYDVEMLRNYRVKAVKLGLGLPWHDRIDRDIEPATVAKYESFLNVDEVRYILRQTAELRSYFGYE
ncbi:sulfotransferase [Microcoleus sp. herbarium7]|uniref:sulfotransferase family protein n=1 Tax=Microcoleus sp. herbarium7 TaxID=3055435 RepID=UPI002FD49082